MGRVSYIGQKRHCLRFFCYNHLDWWNLFLDTTRYRGVRASGKVLVLYNTVAAADMLAGRRGLRARFTKRLLCMMLILHAIILEAVYLLWASRGYLGRESSELKNTGDALRLSTYLPLPMSCMAERSWTIW